MPLRRLLGPALLFTLVMPACRADPRSPDSEVTVHSSDAAIAAAPPSRSRKIVEPPDPPERGPANGTEVAEQANRLFETQKFEAAAPLLRAVVAGESGDDDEHRQFAEYRLAIALFKLELYQASYAIFAEIGNMPEHRQFAASLRWLGRLASELPERADVVERVGRYDPKLIAKLDDPAHHERAMQLMYLSGAYQLRNRNYEEALARLSAVDEKSQFFVLAQLASGDAQLGQKMWAQGAAAFGRAEAAIGSGAASSEDARLRDLARLAMGSALLSAAIQVDEGWAVDAKGVAAAVDALARVDPNGEYGLDAALEMARGFLLSGDSGRALGVLSSLSGAEVPTVTAFEVDALRAAVSFANCRVDEANAAVLQLEKNYEPTSKELAALLDRAPFAGDNKEEAFLGLIGSDGTGLSAVIRKMALTIAADRQVLANLEYRQFLVDEGTRLDRLSKSFRDSPIGADEMDALDLARDIVSRSAGSRAADLFRRALDQLTPARSLVLEAIKSGAQSNADKQARGRLFQSVYRQHVTALVDAGDPLRTGRGKRPASPKDAGEVAIASKCGK
ncbi:MAG: hypothetical protein U0271_27670 [Polyangiaceae bacterium]